MIPSLRAADGRRIPMAVQAAMPSLTRLMSAMSRTTLELWGNGEVLTPSPAFCAAIAAAPLVRLCYAEAGLFVDFHAGLSLHAAVTRHPTLRHLAVSSNRVAPYGSAAVGAALALLVAAHSPLTTLCIAACNLGNHGLLPLIDALPRNTRLRRLECKYNDISYCAAARLLAAVLATASLTHLEAAGARINIPELAEAEAVAAARAT